MEKQYKIKIETAVGQPVGRILSYEDIHGAIISNKATSDEDYEVIDTCRDLANLLDAKELEVIIKAK